MSKEILMTKFGITEEQWNVAFNQQISKFKKRFPEETEEQINTRANNSMKLKLMRDKVSGKKTCTVCVLGQFPTISWNMFRAVEAKKIKEGYNDQEKFLEDCKNGIKYKQSKNNLFDDNGKIIDNFGNIINESNPKESDNHIMFGLYENGEVFIGAVPEKMKNNIVIGLNQVEIQQSKSPATYFGQPIMNVINSNKIKENINKEVVIEQMKIFTQKISDFVIVPKSVEEIKSLANDKVCMIDFEVFDIENGNFATTINGIMNDDLILKARLPEALMNQMMNYVAQDIQIKLIFKSGYNRDPNSDEYNVDAMMISCDVKDLDLVSTESLEDKEIKVVEHDW